MTEPPRSVQRRSPVLAGLLGLLVPGLGHLYVGQSYRGAVLFLATAICSLTVAWHGVTGWYAAPAILWLWSAWDAASCAAGRRRSAALPLAAVLIMAYGIGFDVTGMDPAALTRNLDRAASIIRPMLRPDFISRRQVTNVHWVELEVPCGPAPPPAVHEEEGVTIRVSPDCGNPGDSLIFQATGLWPDAQTEVYWRTEIGDVYLLGDNFTAPLYLTSSTDGNLNAAIRIPINALSAAPDPTIPLPHRVYARQARDLPGFQLSTNGTYVLQGISQTIALALMATTLGMLAAIPMSLFAARNLMAGNAITLVLYTLTRTVLNILRSIEALIIAIIFVVVVGLGPFAGLIALTIHTSAALAKLFSESIEGIDPGPLEAVRATGANWAQVVRYAVVPQIVPPFASFTIYRWDINVRSSTIIGFVGGGGIGFFLYQWIFKGDFRAVSASFVTIAAVVISLDYVSARIRARLV